MGAAGSLLIIFSNYPILKMQKALTSHILTPDFTLGKVHYNKHVCPYFPYICAYPSGISAATLMLWTLGHYTIHLQHLHLILHPEQEQQSLTNRSIIS